MMTTVMKFSYGPFVLFLALLAPTPACSAGARGGGFGADAATVSMNRARGTIMKSYSTNHASPARSGRVDAPHRLLHALTRVGSLARAPRFVLVNEAGDHVVLDHDERFEIRDAAGSPTASGGKISNAPMQVLADAVLTMDSSVAMNGAIGTPDGKLAGVSIDTTINEGDKRWALRLGTTDFSYIVQQKSHRSPGGVASPEGGFARTWNESEEKLVLSTEKFYSDERHNSMTVWSAQLPGRGVGAIAPDGRMVVAMTDRRFLVYDTKLRGVFRAPDPLAQAKLSFVPDDISIVDAGVALLGAEGSGGPRFLHVLDMQGHELWKVSAAFRVDSPPLDGGAGRVYLVGQGLAAVEDGETLWSQASSAQVYATALSDGSLLVAAGPELRVVGRDGSIKQRLAVPGGHPLVAPPAVAADGSAWLATSEGLYLAR